MKSHNTIISNNTTDVLFTNFEITQLDLISNYLNEDQIKSSCNYVDEIDNKILFKILDNNYEKIIMFLKSQIEILNDNLILFNNKNNVQKYFQLFVCLRQILMNKIKNYAFSTFYVKDFNLEKRLEKKDFNERMTLEKFFHYIKFIPVDNKEIYYINYTQKDFKITENIFQTCYDTNAIDEKIYKNCLRDLTIKIDFNYILCIFQRQKKEFIILDKTEKQTINFLTNYFSIIFKDYKPIKERECLLLKNDNKTLTKISFVSNIKNNIRYNDNIMSFKTEEDIKVNGYIISNLGSVEAWFKKLITCIIVDNVLKIETNYPDNQEASKIKEMIRNGTQILKTDLIELLDIFQNLN